MSFIKVHFAKPSSILGLLQKICWVSWYFREMDLRYAMFDFREHDFYIVLPTTKLIRYALEASLIF